MMKATITIEENDFRAFKSMCAIYGYKISTRIQKLIKDDLHNHDRAILDIHFREDD